MVKMLQSLRVVKGLSVMGIFVCGALDVAALPVKVSESPPPVVKMVFDEDAVITGVVVDASGEPIPGVTVVVLGTTTGTATDVDGTYSIDVPTGGILRFSFIGYQTKEVAVQGQSVINVTLDEDTASLDEIVVVGYGTLEKKDLTSAVSSLNERDLITGTVSPLLAIRGKVPGLSIRSSNGTDPNAGVSIQLRGVNSVNASQGPLVVIDGVPGGSINSVVREDIASIEVLRDASAAAIYGTRASGGVILITTKQAKRGELNVNYTSEVFTETIRRRANTLSAEQFLANGLGEDFGHNTDWFQEVTNRLPVSHRHVINLNGGSENAKIYATFNTRDATGVALGSDRKETGGRLNTQFRLFDGLVEITSNLSYSQANANFTNNGIFDMALQLNPTMTPYDATDVTGLNVWTGGYDWFNPVADIQLRKDQREYKYLQANSIVKVNISDALSASAMVAIKNNDEYGTFWRSKQHKTSRETGVDGYASQDFSKWVDQTFEGFLTYNKLFDNHSVNAVGGYSFQEFNGQGFSANNSDFPVDGLQDYALGQGRFLADGRAGMGSWRNPRVRLMAFFGRVNYSFMDRYLLTASVRHEASSKFAPQNRWGSFPAISVGWRVTEEQFMQSVPVLNELKFRAGYGATGNEGFGAGAASRMYGADTWWLIDGSWRRTYGVSHNQNTNLQWETKHEYNVGMDFAFLDNKFTGRVDVYRRDIDNLIYDISVSQPPAIHDRTTMNVGMLRNSGWEAELTWNAIRKNHLTYSTTVIGSANRSTLVNLWGSQTFWDRKSFPAPGSPGSAVRLYPGEDIGRFFVWRHAGFTENGNWMLYDREGEPFDVTQRAKRVDDKQFVGNAIPKLILAWNHSLIYRNFDVNLYMRGWFGHDIFNMINMYYSLPLVNGQNVLSDAFEKHRDIRGEKELSDYWVERGDFLRVDALSVGYSFPLTGSKYFKSLRVYANAQDLFVFTNYSGLDPEVNINGLEPGFEERNTYPQTRTFMMGVQVGF